MTPLVSRLHRELIEQAGFQPCGEPGGRPGKRIGDRIVDRSARGWHHFTGSTAVGIPLSERAARRMGKVQLELGGKNPPWSWISTIWSLAARDIVSAALQ